MGDKIPFYVQVLTNELKKRQGVNKRYSIRAFAAYLRVDPTYISKCLMGKQSMSFEIAEKVIARLSLIDDQRIEFLRSIAEQQSCMRLNKHDASVSGCGS